MAGNVWEWMENYYDKDEDVRALRGGSWFVDNTSLRCSARDVSNPVGRGSGVGFRVLRSKENSPAKIRKKTAGLDLSEKDIEDAIAWAKRK
ncbi:MAG: SUMF1/EgtB/PvdO family nonheme iron enzyme [Candidatus Aminicenantes bacterium]|nr:SUMF1/EgtB/PvdO family nonheme iron enzyme [Candidatus Aminicenantes bacterium]